MKRYKLLTGLVSLLLFLGVINNYLSAGRSKTMDHEDKVNKSEFIITGKVINIRDSVDPRIKLALIEKDTIIYESQELHERYPYRWEDYLYVSFPLPQPQAKKKSGKKPQPVNLEVAKEYILFLVRPEDIGEFFLIDNYQGAEHLAQETLESVTRMAQEIPVCSAACADVKPGTNPGKCKLCKRSTLGNKYKYCNTCALDKKKCRVCGKQFEEPLLQAPRVKAAPPVFEEEIMEELKANVYMKPHEAKLTLTVGQIAGICKGEIAAGIFVTTDYIMRIDGDCVDKKAFIHPQGPSPKRTDDIWHGVKAIKKGKATVKVYLLEENTEACLVRIVKVAVK